MGGAGVTDVEVGEGEEPADPPEFIDPFAERLQPDDCDVESDFASVVSSGEEKISFHDFPSVDDSSQNVSESKIHFMTFRKLKSNLNPNLFLVDRRELKNRCACCNLIVLV